MTEASHFLAVNHESYDGDTVFGVFGSFTAARDFLESPAALELSSTASYADIEEWAGAELVAKFERRGYGWEERRYAHG